MAIGTVIDSGPYQGTRRWELYRGVNFLVGPNLTGKTEFLKKIYTLWHDPMTGNWDRSWQGLELLTFDKRNISDIRFANEHPYILPAENGIEDQPTIAYEKWVKRMVQGTCYSYIEGSFIWFDKEGIAVDLNSMPKPFKNIIASYIAALRMQKLFNSSSRKGILLLDQPTLGLHVTNSKQVVNALTAIAPDIYIGIVTHCPATIHDDWSRVTDVAKL